MPQLARFLAAARREEGSLQELAHLRYELRRFLGSVEKVERMYGITPRQLQLLLGVAGFTGMSRASISELAEFLQEKHNSVVGLIDRAEHSGLVQREAGSSDRRVVFVSLTARGWKALASLLPAQWENAARFREKLAGSEGEQKASSHRQDPAADAGRAASGGFAKPDFSNRDKNV
jgi:DNA-binding MarR family transcriptional regulator